MIEIAFKVPNTDKCYMLNCEINAIDPQYHSDKLPQDVSEYSIVNYFFNSSLGGCINDIKSDYKESIEENRLSKCERVHYTVLTANSMKWFSNVYAKDSRSYYTVLETFSDEWYDWLHEKISKLQDRKRILV